AWFEDDEFGSWEEFPIDLYFADLDGNWIDQDSDGLFDNHTGDVQPEIWIGRIYAPPLQYLDEITLYRRYFDKNHAYRTGGLPLPHRALSFVDDDWFYWTTCYTDLVYSNVTVVNNKYQTTAANYRNHLKNGYEWIHLCSHSSPWGHTFMIPNGPYAGTVFNYEIFYLEPDAHFLNLFACSGTRFVEENNVGNWYIFHSDNGLTVIGSTKTGSMLYFDDFYRPLGQGKNIGNAFKEWFILNGELSWGWFYGLNILGDPTLKPMMSDGEVARFESFDGFTEVIAPDPESDGNLFCAMVGDTIWVVWESGRSQSNGRCDILSAYRTTNWSDAIPVGPQVYWDYAPTITHTQDGQPIAIWSAFKGSAYHYNLYYSLFSGTSWSNPVIIDSDPSYDFRARAVTDNAGKVWLFFQSRRDVNSNIYYATYTTSWSTPQRVTDTPEDELSPQPLVDYSGRVWVFYHRQDPTGSRIYASYYDNGWHELGPISKGQTRAYHPIGAASDDKIWLVWHTFDQGPGDIYYSYYDGNNWTDPLPVTTDPGEDLLPSITVDQGGSPWVSWQSDRDGTWQIYTSYYKGGWQSPEKISDNLAAINSGTVTDNNNQIWFLWQGYDDNWEIYADYRCGTGVGEVTKGKAEEPKLKSLYRIGDDIRIDKDFALIDASGRMVKKGKGVINTRGLPPGIFFLKVIDSIKKVILVR
ncbi:MAG TPA: hypothetical protein EYP24_04055, partial [bacterium (Candidatus Stahlbacteria)]|nr:hypothetical protein [Candidatus Stahlbacteria bacterium]